MQLSDKLRILTSAAKYDVACTSSGSDRKGNGRGMGNTVASGICHSFSADGRCISLLKVLMTNYCVYDCQYCVNRVSNDVERASFTPEELADLTIAFYRRNYIEGLFLSSGVANNPDGATERMLKVLELLRRKYCFNGYIHAKTIPGTSRELITKMGLLADRISVNIEMPSERSLKLLAPDKSKDAIVKPMEFIQSGIKENAHDLVVYRHARKFAPAGQSTQMIIGATPDSDFQILRLSESLYKKYTLKRVFYSAYVPVGTNALLPLNQPPPLLREHRLYQADWLLRFYGFSVSELLDERQNSLDPLLDPKCMWAMRNLSIFPIEINRADYGLLLRVPGIGVKSARNIVMARRSTQLTFADLKKLGIVLKRAIYFITCSGKYMHDLKFDDRFIYHNLTAETVFHPMALQGPSQPKARQLSFFDGVRETAAVQQLSGYVPQLSGYVQKGQVMSE